MKKSVLISIFAAVLMLVCLSASAEMTIMLNGQRTLAIPDGIEAIEEAAFEDIGDLDAVFIPKSVTSIAQNAFSDATLTVYGYTGSAAQTFANATGRYFQQVDITDIQLESPKYEVGKPPMWVSPGTPFTFSAKAISAIFGLDYTFIAEKDGVAIATSDENDTITFTEGGTYDIRVNVKSSLAHGSALFENALTVGEPVKFASDELLLGVGRSMDILAADETRSVSLTFDKTGIISLWGRTATGLKAGECIIKAVAVQPEGTVTTFMPLRVYTPVTSVSLIDAHERVFIGTQVQLNASVLPITAEFASVEWHSSDEQIATVSETGLITALTQGECVITATADGITYSHNLKSCVPVSTIEITAPFTPLYTSGKIALSARVTPDNADEKGIVWSSLDTVKARVDANGIVTGVGAGTVQILGTAADGSGVFGVIELQVYQGVSSITLSHNRERIHPDEEIPLTFKVLPENALDKTLVWSSDNESVATVDQNGVITTYKPGIVTISAAASNGVRKGITLNVVLNSPAKYTLNTNVVHLKPGEKYQLFAKQFPEYSDGTGTWRTLNANVAKIDQNGIITAVASGTVQLGIQSDLDPAVVGVCNVTVSALNTSRTHVMPHRRTAISGIASNRTLINNVKKSAHDELSDLVKRGVISSSEANSRKSVVDKAFAMYDFPWMTLKSQLYWNEGYSEGGAKYFEPGVVYFGMPYTQNQRMYKPENAISENRYYSAGSYYILNQNNLKSGEYCGSDCSSMVAMCYQSYLPSSVSLSSWNTSRFSTATTFKTLSKSTELHPGDIIVSKYGHVVMFLYYVNSSHTQFVIIEQGGTEAAINTISASVKSHSDYIKSSSGYNYEYRRLSSWN